MLQPSNTLAELKKKVMFFIKQELARGSLKQRSETTVKNYTNAIFSKHATSLQGYLSEYLPGKTLLNLVYCKDTNVTLLQPTLVQFLVKLTAA
jgi:hypothetical protein